MDKSNVFINVSFLSLTKIVEKAKNVPDKDCFWPSQVWISRFMTRFNLKYKKNSKTLTPRRDCYFN